MLFPYSTPFRSTCTSHVAVLPLASVTVHTTTVTPFGNTAPASVDVLLKLFVIVEPVQLSPNAVGLNSLPTKIGRPTPASVVRVASATQVIVGNSSSSTVTCTSHVAVLPLASVTVHTTTVTPFGNTAPASVDVLLKLFVIVEPVQLSPNAVGLNSLPTTV